MLFMQIFLLLKQLRSILRVSIHKNSSRGHCFSCITLSLVSPELCVRECNSRYSVQKIGSHEFFSPNAITWPLL